MILAEDQIQNHNQSETASHKNELSQLTNLLSERGKNPESILRRLTGFQVTIPSWALGAGGTRFGRFSIGGEPRNLHEKIEDIGLIHALNRSSGAVSLHIPWDIPKDSDAIKEHASGLGIRFDAVNSNTFQDQPEQEQSYKFGSLSHSKKEVRDQAVQHNIEVIEYGMKLGSKALTVWLADGSNFPGQQNLRKALNRTQQALSEIYASMPDDWKLLIEYKPFEPNFYSMVIPDWGTSFLLANKVGERAKTLVDLGHHLPNTNIEQIVATLMLEGKLGGFHFNDSKYADDDLTTGTIKPYQLFLIFCELVDGIDNSNNDDFSNINWMIDASHNTKDPLEDLMQSVEAIMAAFAKALLVDRNRLEEVREENDVVLAQEVLQDAWATDVRPLIREARMKSGGAANPIRLFRDLQVRKKLIKERGTGTAATGL
jgi:L-rhamnose isomerase / sugar isomerase